MAPFLRVFDSQVYNQYLLIAIAVLIVISIKIVMARKAYQRKLDSFVHPDSVISELKKKVNSVDEAQTLLAFNLHKLVEDQSRMRNIAFLIALLKSYGASLKSLKPKVQETLTKLEGKKLAKANKTYKAYILNEFQAQCEVQQKNREKAFYTI